MTIDEVLSHITREDIREYELKLDVLIDFVNNKLSNMSNIDELIGNNSLAMMYDNHSNHANFMRNAFEIKDADLISNTAIWAYSAYYNHGFSYEYFECELLIWKEAIEQYLASENSQNILAVYDWMISNHSTYIKKSLEPLVDRNLVHKKYIKGYDTFVKNLLRGKSKECIEYAISKIIKKDDLLPFLDNVVFCAMYDIGLQWQQGKISVAQEHLASSVVKRILSYLYSQFVSLDYHKGRGLVTAATNEFHEIGSRVVADILEIDGWEIKHLGANTPEEDLIDFIENNNISFVGLSVAMPFNVIHVKRVIKQIRKHKEYSSLKIFVGGKVFNENPDLWKKVGADAYAKNGYDAIKITRQWWKEG